MADLDYRGINEVCKPPFEVDGETYYSFLCRVGDSEGVSYFTYLYAKDKEDALIKLEEDYQHFERRRLV